MRSLHRPSVHTLRDSLLERVDDWDPAELGAPAEPAPPDSGRSPGGAGDAVSLDADSEVEARVEPDVDAEREAQERREAERLAHERALVEAFARGRDEGLAEGRCEGERVATERLHHAVCAVEQACAAISAGEEQWVGGAIARENLSALAVAIARHVIGRKVSTDTKIVRDLVTVALAEFPIDEGLRVRIHPDDLAAIEHAKNLAAIVGGHSPKWIADPGIERGGCLVEGREHIVDGRVDTALERVYRQLTDTYA